MDELQDHKDDPKEMKTILHLGLGSFHRAHQAYFLQELIDIGADNNWRITAANVRDDMPELIASLISQNCEYTLETVSPEAVRKYFKIKSIQHIIPWTSQLEGVIECGSEASTKIISFTVTESGYYLVNNELNVDHPEVKSDIETGSMNTIYGVLYHVLKSRMDKLNGSELAKVTLLSCDNLRSNGNRFRRGFTHFLEARKEHELLDWLNSNTATPCCMVDRITPRPTKDVIDRVRDATGRTDPCAVMSESFLQWVIEDDFIAGRPDWNNRKMKISAEFTEDVSPYEEAKIRILNASHSVIAWAGTIKGYHYIHEAMADTQIAHLAQTYIFDVIPCLEPSPLDLHAYMMTAGNRFRNAALNDTCQRVAADSYSKMSGFILPTFRARLERGLSFEATASIIAAFYIFLKMLDDNQVPYSYYDPLCNRLKLREMMTSKDPLSALCNESALWWDLAGNKEFITEVKRAHAKVSTWLTPKEPN